MERMYRMWQKQYVKREQTKKFLELMKSTNTQIQRDLWIPNKKNFFKSKPRCTVVKIPNTKDKGVSSEQLRRRRSVYPSIRVCWENNFQPEICILKKWRLTKNISEKQNLEECVTSRPSLKIFLKKFPQKWS